MLKAGWKTSEFWVLIISQVLSLLVIVGVIPQGERQTLEGALSAIVGAIFTLIVNAGLVVKYTQARLELKSDQSGPPDDGPGTLPLRAALIFGGLLLFAGGAQAQAPAHQPTSLLPWRDHVERRLDQMNRQPQSDPAVLQTLQQLAANQQQILALLSQQRQTPAPAQPQIIVLGGPLQSLPHQGAPLQTLPHQGPPLQVLPHQGPPLQQLPIAGPPIQQLPHQGGPLQQLPIGPPGDAKPTPLPAKPDPILPGNGPPLQQISPPPQPMPQAPAGYQRYTPAIARR